MIRSNPLERHAERMGESTIFAAGNSNPKSHGTHALTLSSISAHTGSSWALLWVAGAFSTLSSGTLSPLSMPTVWRPRWRRHQIGGTTSGTATAAGSTIEDSQNRKKNESSSRNKLDSIHDSSVPENLAASEPPPSNPVTVTLADVCPNTRLTLPWWEEALLLPCFILLCAPIFSFIMLGVALVPFFGWAGAVVRYLPLLCTYWTLLYFDLVPRRRRLSHPALSCWLLRAVVRYFNYHVIVEDPSSLQPATPYIGAQSPHGIYPIATICGAPFNSAVFPGQDAYCLAASALQLQPFLWQWMECLGGRPISAAAIKEVVDQGDVCCLVPGGIAEMFMLDSSNRTEQILIRRGFVREALKNDVDIVPIYHFNHTQTFSYVLPPYLNAWLSVACRKTGLPGCFLIGRWGLFVPHKVDMFTVVGRPIPVRERIRQMRDRKTRGGKEGKIPGTEEVRSRECSVVEPTVEEIEAIVAEYKEALRRIYYNFRPVGSKRELIMIDNRGSPGSTVVGGNKEEQEGKSDGCERSLDR